MKRIGALATQVEEAKRLREEAVVVTSAMKASEANSIFDVSTNPDWPRIPLGDVADIRSGVTLGRTLSGPTVQLPYLRVANVQDGHLDLRLVKEVTILVDEQDKWLLRPGDVLVTEGGDWDKLGRGTVWRGELERCIHQNHIFRIRADPQRFDSDFLAAVFESPYGKEYFRGAAKQTTNLASINQRQLKAFPVFQPPLSEQHRIIAHFDTLEVKVDELRRLQSETATELAALLPAILAQAFAGNL